MTTVRLTGRSGSHFTRVVRMLAIELGITVELDVIHDLTGFDPVLFGGNPALKMPTLQSDAGPLFGTDNICRKLAELVGRDTDPRVVLTHHVTSDLVRNAQELVWHAMSAQVQLVIGVRISKLPADSPFFAKGRAGLVGALEWLEHHLDAVLAALPSPRDVSVLELTLFCLIEHLNFRTSVPLDPYPRLRAFAADYGTRESAQRTPFRADPPPAAPQETR